MPGYPCCCASCDFYAEATQDSVQPCTYSFEAFLNQPEGGTIDSYSWTFYENGAPAGSSTDSNPTYTFANGAASLSYSLDIAVSGLDCGGSYTQNLASCPPPAPCIGMSVDRVTITIDGGIGGQGQCPWPLEKIWDETPFPLGTIQDLEISLTDGASAGSCGTSRSRPEALINCQNGLVRLFVHGEADLGFGGCAEWEGFAPTIVGTHTGTFTNIDGDDTDECLHPDNVTSMTFEIELVAT